MTATRLNKNLALWLGISRRQADDLITAHRVRVNGQIAQLGQRIDSQDEITLDRQIVRPQFEIRLIKFHKPSGYTCSRRQQGNTPTIYQLLPKHLQHLKSVGRLDKDSSGLLLLTNDGDLAYRMTHPKFHKRKVYHVTLDQELQALHQQIINDYGVQLQDGRSQLSLTRLDNNSRLHWQVEMSEGRNRQIRRTFASLGYQVTQLHRTSFGSYQLGDLAAGRYEILTDQSA